VNAIITTLWQTTSLLVQGLGTTTILWLGSIVIALPIGLITGIIRCKQLRIPVIAQLLDYITIVIRGVPLYVQVLIIYFVLPGLVGINLSSFTAGIVALGFCSSAYVSEIVRSGMNSIAIGQWEAAQVLGFTRTQCVQYIVAPQMFKNSLASLINEIVSVMKSTSILATIGVLELTKIGQNIVTRSMHPLAIYGCIALIYLMLNGIISWAGKWLEKNSNN
jgi:polar amino acid transport system permease protein